MRAKQQKKADEVRRVRVEASLKQQEKVAVALAEKRVTLEKRREAVEQEWEKERLLSAVEKRVSEQEKRENVERLQRMEQYARQQLLRRISDEDARSRALKEQKRAMALARQQVTLQALRRKHALGEVVEELRRTSRWKRVDDALGAL